MIIFDNIQNRNRWYWVDPDLNKCVERDYPKILMTEFKGQIDNCKEIGIKFFASMTEYVLNAMQTQEWQDWYEKFNKMSFEEKCKSFEMELMISFFVLSWYLPSFRWLIVVIWAWVLKTYLGDDGSEMKYPLMTVWYFSCIMAVYTSLKWIGLIN